MSSGRILNRWAKVGPACTVPARKRGPPASPQPAPKEFTMRRFLRKMLKSQSGQGMSEYLIIVALIAIAAIGVVTVFGRDIRELFSGTTDSLAGNQSRNTAVKATVKSTKNLKTFGKYNAASGD